MQPDLPELLTGIPVPDLDPQDVREASELIRSYCGWHIAPAIDETLTLPINAGQGIVYLPTYQLNSVASVIVDGVTLLAADYEVWLGRQSRIDLGRLWRPARLVITINHGYTEAPADVVKVVKQLASGGSTGASVRVGQIQISSSTGVAAGGITQLRPYQLPAVA